ncbi:hypothetical protein DICVIV_08914 [Dictyocaulus viviparus]|uniref:Uncharacterized protein n=1 Tax=Dictyocaulus viviparus TaxID=29172 RepID=A0A0D8XRL3_DICVI|nr:hypothetical protein DICVIV_08914 [Dictyocaulus viviparus]
MVLRTESDRVPQVLISQASTDLRRTRSESQLATKLPDTVSMSSSTSAGFEDEILSVCTMSSLESEPVVEKLLPSFEEVIDANDTLTQSLLTPRAKDATLTPGMTISDIQKYADTAQTSSMQGLGTESASSFTSSLSFRTEDDLDENGITRNQTASTRKQRLHATLRASKRRVLDLMQKRRVGTFSCSETTEIGADAMDLKNAANPANEPSLTPTGKRSPIETQVSDRKEKKKKGKRRSPSAQYGQLTPSLQDSPTASTGFAHSKITKFMPLQENVVWKQSLDYDLDGISSSSPSRTSKYMNITIHAKELPSPIHDSGTSCGNQLTAVSEVESSQDILLGYVSLYIPQILDDCQLTLSNYHREVYQLKPPTDVQSIIETSASEFCRHAGYDPRLCYGDVTLGFRYFPNGFPHKVAALSNEERFA